MVSIVSRRWVRRYNNGIPAGRFGFISRLGQDIFLYSIAFRLALELTLPSISLVLMLFPPGIKRQGREADHLPESGAEVNNNAAIPPISPHDIVLS